MNKSVYQILESFIPFEKLKKSKSVIHLKPLNKPQNLQPNKSSITFTSPLLTEALQNEADFEHLKSHRKNLIEETVKLQFKYFEILEKTKQSHYNEKFLNQEQEILIKKKEKLIDDKKKKEVDLRNFNSKLLIKLGELKGKKAYEDELKSQLNERKAFYNKKNGELSEKNDEIKNKLDEKYRINEGLLEKIKKNLEEHVNFLKIHTILELKDEINKISYEERSLNNQIKEMEFSLENLIKNSLETEKSLKNDIDNKDKLIFALKDSNIQKAKTYEKEFSLLQESDNHKKNLKKGVEESIQNQKHAFLHEMKENDNQKLRLIKEQAHKKELYEGKYKKIMEIAKQKTTQISYKKLSSADVEVEEMRQSKRMLKSTFESDLNEILAKREDLRTKNNALNEQIELELLKKTRWNLKINQFIENKRQKESNFQNNNVEKMNNKALHEKFVESVKVLESKKQQILVDLEKLISGNEEIQKKFDSIGVLRIEIEVKKKEKYWFNHIMKEMSSQNENIRKKIKESKKFTEKTQKEMNSQKTQLDKYREKLANLEKIFDSLEKKMEFS